ncbi:MAG: type I DNA topoisomerase, partial [Parcubacteria group bacterium]|nr:type I DNA topoisomerase [Parcubacteria group bacterium]
VTSSVGHIRDLPKNNKKAIDIESGFIPRYEISPGKEGVVQELRKLCGEADEVLLATDPDREGEAIAWHIAQICDLGDVPRAESRDVGPKLKRIVFHEITKSAVQEAIKHPRDIDQNLRRAQEARRILDRLVGYDLSGLIWKKLRYGLSAGRVQSPALRIIMEREREIRAFKPEDFWVISALTETKTKKGLPLICSVEPRDKKEVEHILSVGKKGVWEVKEIKETQMKRSPRAPFTTSTLQQAASSQLGFAPSWTMRTAQRLYEAGHITYMRTDSTNIGTEAQKQALSIITKLYGKEYPEARVYKTKSKNAQEAHEAIRPTHVSVKNSGATDEQKKLYGLIWRRFISSQMKDAQLLKTKITITINKGEIPDFAANGSQTIFDGWLAADGAAKGENVELPKVIAGEKVTLVEIKDEQKQTQPPSRYSEAGLIKELEKRGIGRPSTYASIMKTIADRGYVTKDGKTLFPTDTGEVVSDFLEKNFASYISDTFTAEMENELDEIASGSREYKKTLADFYTPFSKDVQSKENIPKINDLGNAPAEFKCPKCQSAMIIKLGRGGKFMSCARFPDCDGARTIEGLELKPDEPIGVQPETGEKIYLLSGRFGPYVQLGEKTKENPKPKRASVPKTFDLTKITITDALKFLSIPRVLGVHPQTGKTITASIGRFGPYIVHDTDFRSLKTDDVYTILLPRALEILAEEKKTRKRKRPV